MGHLGLANTRGGGLPNHQSPIVLWTAFNTVGLEENHGITITVNAMIVGVCHDVCHLG